MNTNDGRIRVVRQMDREKAETIRLAIRAEDVAAATTGQTASGWKTRIYCVNKIVLSDICYLFILSRDDDDHLRRCQRS